MLQCLDSSMTTREQLLVSEQLSFLLRVVRKGGQCVCVCLKGCFSLNLSSEHPPPDDSGHLFATRKVLRSTPGMQWALDKVSSGGMGDDLVEEIISSPGGTGFRCHLRTAQCDLGLLGHDIVPGTSRQHEEFGTG